MDVETEAHAMNEALDLAKDEADERPEDHVAGITVVYTDAELTDHETRCRRLAQRSIDRGDVDQAAEFWFALWSARREIAYRCQLHGPGHVYGKVCE